MTLLRKLSLGLCIVLVLTSVLWHFETAEAAAVCTNLTFGNSATDATSYATASISPAGDALILATLTTRTGITADPTQPTVTGNGLTWVVEKTVVYDSTSSSRRRLTVLRAMGAAPSAGAITFDEAGQTQTAASWSVDQCTGVDTGGTNGSGAVVQSVTNSIEDAGVATSITGTLAGFSGANNVTFGAFAEAGTFGFTVGSSFTLLGADIGDGDGSNMASTEWKAANDTSVDGSWATASGSLGVVAIEIKAAAVAPLVNQKLTLTGSKLTIKGAKMTIGTPRYWPVISVDVMKFSKDVLCSQPSTSTVDTQLDKIVALGANYVSVSGFYDDSSCGAGTSLGMLGKWNTEARLKGLKMWWRMKDLSFEGDYSVTKATSSLGSIHQTAMRDWLTANGSLLQSGDIFTPFAEVQNGGINGISDCGASGICQFDGAASFNTFIRTIQADAESRVPAGVNVGYWGFDGFIAAGLCNVDHSGTSYLEASTITAMHNLVTVDHYPESCPSDFATDLPIMHTALGASTQILIGEYGTITDSGNQSQIDDINAAMPPLIADPLVVGFNYWNLGPAGQEALVDGSTVERPGYYTLARFLKTVRK